MNYIKKLFGPDKSKEFLETLPNISIRQFFTRLVYLGLSIFSVFFLKIPLGLIHTNYPKFYSDLNLGNPIIRYSIAVVLLGVILFFAYKLLNITFKLLKQQYFSLPALSVFKHTVIIAFVTSVFFYGEFIFVFLNDKKSLSEVLNSFDMMSLDIISEAATTQTTSNFLDFLLPSLAIILLLVGQWILVGIVEELLSRAGVYRSLRKILPRIFAVIISAGIFSMIHIDHSILGHINAFIIGVIYAWYYEYKNNLMTITLLHFFHDGFLAGLVWYSAALTVQHLF